MKRLALSLFGFGLLILILWSAYSVPPLTAAALISPTASPTAATPQPTGSPTFTPSAIISTTVSSDDPAARVNAALEKDAALTKYRMDLSWTTGPVTPTQAISPTVVLDLRVERSGNDSHALVARAGSPFVEVITVGDRVFLRDPKETAVEQWFIVPPDQWSNYQVNPAIQIISYFLGDSRKFSREGGETLNGARCDVYLQDRAAVVEFFIRRYLASTTIPLETGDQLLDRAESRVWVCDNGYLPRFELHITTKSQGGTDTPVAFDVRVELRDLNGEIQITAPTNAVLLPTPTPLPTPGPLPSKTPAPTLTPRPTIASPQATATATAAQGYLRAAQDWNVVLTDSFDSNVNNWEVGDGKTVENGKYIWNINNRVNIYRGLPEMQAQSDFVASIDARLVSGSPDCGMGISFRNGKDSTFGSMTDYVFYIHNDQRWGFDIIHSPDPGIAQTGVSDAIVPRALNRIQVLAQGEQLTFFVNGKYIGTSQDKTLARGKIGAAVWVLGPGSCEVEFDNFQVNAPPAPAYMSGTGKIILTDWTAGNPNKWKTGSYQVLDAAGTREIVDTKYSWQTTSASDETVLAAPAMAPVVDFDVSVDAKQTSGSEKAEYGLVFRHTDPDTEYVFTVTGYGAYSLSYNQDGDYHVLIFPTSSPAVKIGEVNRLRVIGAGSHFIFYVNGEIVAEVNDEALSHGTVGVTAEGYDKEKPTASFEFSNFTLRELPAPAPGSAPPTPAAATPTSVSSASALQASCSPIATLEDEGRAHLSPGETPVYKSNPPTSGTHHPIWHDAGIYAEPVDVTMEVHNLEHGYVILHYNNISADEINQLAQIVRSDFRKLILAPYPGMSDKISLTAWNHKQSCTAVDKAAIQTFIDLFRDQGPEFGAP